MIEGERVRLDFASYRRWRETQEVKPMVFDRDAPLFSTLKNWKGRVFVWQGKCGAWIPARYVTAVEK